jgi:hypothetical protein
MGSGGKRMNRNHISVYKPKPDCGFYLTSRSFDLPELNKLGFYASVHEWVLS